MSTVLFFTACITISKLAVAQNLPLGQNVEEPLNYLGLPNQFPSSPVLNNGNTLVESNLQAPDQSLNNCPNLEILQNILILLKKLVEQDNNAQFLQPDKKLQVLTYLKKQLERSGPITEDDNNQDIAQPIRKANQAFLLNNTSTRALYQQINDNVNSDPKVEAQLLIKYNLPTSSNAGCKEVLAALIQAVNTAHSQLVNFCQKSGKCNVGDVGNSNVQLNDLPRILNDIIRSSQSQAPQQLQPPTPINIFDIQRPLQPPNRLPNDAIQQEVYNNYIKRLIQNYNLDIARNKQETIDRVLNNIGEKTKMNILQNLLKLQENKAGKSIDGVNKLSYDALIKLYQILKDRSASAVASNQLNTFNYNFQKPVQSYNIPANLLQRNPNINGNVQPNAPYSYNLPQNDKINQLLNPTFNIQERKDLNSVINSLNNLNLNSYGSKTVRNQFQLNPIIRLSPQEQQYFADYLNREVQGNALVDSQRVSVSNLLKLNPNSNNGVVELTYKFKQPQSLLKNQDNAYYYVKYRMPYETFMSKVLESMRSPQLRSNPAKLYEDILTVSNLVEISPELKDIGNNDVTKVITNNGAMLVSARVLSTNSPLDDEYIKILQNLNANLNTNDIVNLVNNENINKGPSNTPSDLKDVNLQNAGLLGQNLDNQNIAQVLSPVQTGVSLSNNARKAYIKTMNLIPGISPNALNPRIMYNTLLNGQSFSPYTFQTPPPRYLSG